MASKPNLTSGRSVIRLHSRIETFQFSGVSVNPILIDTDPGIDDAVALMLAVQRPEIDIRAVTACSGNLRADYSAANALRVLDHVGRSDIPVAVGALAPLSRRYRKDPFYHGAARWGNTCS